MTTCCLCSGLASGRAAARWNLPLLESPNFVVLPSLGSLVEGWLLVVPKQHYISMGALPIDLAEEMWSLKDLVTAKLRSNYGEICVFEHGPGDAKRSVGCGVDHAHLHVVPLAFDLATAATPFMPNGVTWVIGGWDQCKAAFKSGRDYLYLEQPVGQGRIAVHDSIGSQVFRKAIAARLGIPARFDWRQYPHTDVVSRTIRAVRGIWGVSQPTRATGAA